MVSTRSLLQRYRLAAVIGLFGVIFMARVTDSAPYWGERFNLLQPDGTRVEVKVWGDEFYQRVETPDGNTLVRNPKTGWICVAEISEDGSHFIPTDTVYIQNANPASRAVGQGRRLRLSRDSVMNSILKTRRELSTGIEPDMLSEISPQSRPISGAVTGLTLLLDFPDSPGTIPRSEVENYLNLRGYANFGCNGSVKDYFSDVSGGLLDYTNHISEYYTAIHNKSYYTDPSIRYGVRSRELIREALAYLDEAVGFDFSALTTDADGNILAINALYAGEVDNSWSQGLWPHKWILFPVFRTDGVRSRSYQITAIRSDLSLRVFCHENGHMLLGWPDLYDYGHESYGIGDYGLMGHGGRNDNPVPPCAHLRIMAGWDTVIDITDASPGETFTHTQGSQATFLYTHPANPFEYYLFESRRKTGRNASLGDEGLMIWHVDELRTGNNHQDMTCAKHYRVSLVQADGLFDLEKGNNYGGEGDLFSDGDIDLFNKNSLPNSNWWCGGESGPAVWNITSSGSNYTFTVGKPVIANAGPDQRIHSGVLNLDGCESYALSGKIVLCDWSIQKRFSNNPYEIFSAETEQAAFSGLPKGVYDVTLTVTSDEGFTDRDTMVVTSCFISTFLK